MRLIALVLVGDVRDSLTGEEAAHRRPLHVPAHADAPARRARPVHRRRKTLARPVQPVVNRDPLRPLGLLRSHQHIFSPSIVARSQGSQAFRPVPLDPMCQRAHMSPHGNRVLFGRRPPSGRADAVARMGPGRRGCRHPVQRVDGAPLASWAAPPRPSHRSKGRGCARHSVLRVDGDSFPVRCLTDSCQSTIDSHETERVTPRQRSRCTLKASTVCSFCVRLNGNRTTPNEGD